MNKRKGFTLVELLAVVVILAVIALVAVPMILGVIDKAKKGAAVSSVYGFIDALEKNTVIGELTDDSEKLVVPENGDLLIEDIDMTKLSIKGEKPNLGYITFSNKKIVAAGLCVNGYSIDYSNKNASATESDYCSSIQVDITEGVKTTSSVKISVTTNATDIRGYIYKIGDSDWTAETTNAYYTFNNLAIGTTYTVQAKVITTDGSEYTKVNAITTTDIAAPTYSITPSGWAASKTLTITYPVQPEGETYTYSYSIDGGSNWTVVTGLTKQLTFTAEGSVIARVYDGNNYKTASSYAVSQIEAAPSDPTITASNGYPMLNSSGMQGSQSSATITHDTGRYVKTYYSIDEGVTWKEYSDPVSGAFTIIQAKSLSPNGVASNIVTKNISLTAGGLDKEAYDNNDSTGSTVAPGAPKYVTVDSSAIGKDITILADNGCATLYNSSEAIVGQLCTSSGGTSSNSGTVPAGAVKIVFSVNTSSRSGTIYEFKKLISAPTITVTGGTQSITSAGIQTAATNATISYDTTTGNVNTYSIDGGTTWHNYTSALSGTFTEVKAKTVTADNQELTSASTIDGLVGYAFDGNNTTYGTILIGTVKNLTADSSVIGKTVTLLANNGCATMYNASSAIIGQVCTAIGSVSSISGTVPSGTTKVVISGNTSSMNASIYEVTVSG